MGIFRTKQHVGRVIAVAALTAAPVVSRSTGRRLWNRLRQRGADGPVLRITTDHALGSGDLLRHPGNMVTNTTSVVAGDQVPGALGGQPASDPGHPPRQGPTTRQPTAVMQTIHRPRCTRHFGDEGEPGEDEVGRSTHEPPTVTRRRRSEVGWFCRSQAACWPQRTRRSFSSRLGHRLRDVGHERLRRSRIEGLADARPDQLCVWSRE